MTRFLYSIAAALVILATTPAGAAGQTGSEATAKEIEQALISPCCWRQPLDMHHSGTADNMKAEIRQLLSDGQSRGQIMAYYTDRYGEQILSAPKKEGFNILAWVLPGFVMLLGAGVIFVSLRSWRSATSEEEDGQQGQNSAPTVANRARIEADLEAMD